MLKIENFSFSFGPTRVLKNIGFELPGGDYLSIIGPNGAGKSTLLKCILRLHDHGKTEGKIFVKGRPLSEYSQKKLARIISYVPQAGGWIPPFTVSELLQLSRYPYAKGASGLDARDLAAVERALKLTELEPLAGRSLRNISGGERQKAYLAAALAQGTEVMLLDEPASFLDPKHSADLNFLLRRLNTQEGLTIVTVTHDLNHPLQSNGQALVLKNGEKIFFGRAVNLLDGVLENAYQHQFIYLKHPVTELPVVLGE